MVSKYFELGKLVATKAIYDMMQTDKRFNIEVGISLQRYCVMDWGSTCDDSKQLNDEAVLYGDGRILAVYETSKGKIWIITEADRSATTVLFPSDY